MSLYCGVYKVAAEAIQLADYFKLCIAKYDRDAADRRGIDRCRM